LTPAQDGFGVSRLEFATMVWPSIGAFLKEQRRGIPRDAASLGTYVRQPARRGKVVTQEELAEAIGVSRVWYAMLESGTALKTSPRLLIRLAEVLTLSDERRTALFRLALPEIPIGDRAFAALNDLSSVIQLRTAARRLHSATSETEVLLTVSETIAGVFGDSDIAGAFKRLQPGRWDYPVVMGGEKWANAMAEMNHVLYEGMTPEQIDETMLHGSFAEPGHAGTRNELFGKLSQKRRLDETFAAHGFGACDFLNAQIKSRDGIEANVFVLYVKGQKDFTETDRAVFGTLADLASLALSQ
jgi:transcriptional regulator with XRE-family HTH domain